MALKHGHATDTLASYTRDGDYGPAQIKTATVRFEQRLRGVLGRINAAIRRGIIEDDVLNLSGDRDTLAVDDPGPFDTDDSRAAIGRFIQWLREQLDEELLTVVGQESNPFIMAGYAQGLRAAGKELKELDVPIDQLDIEEAVTEGRFSRPLQTLFTRTYGNLESISDAVVSDVRDTLLEGYREGLGPREIARNLTNRVDSVGKHRATVLARSEMMNAWSEAYLDRTEAVQEDSDVDIGVSHSEWMTAGDSRVCPVCRPLDGRIFTISEMRTRTFDIGGQTFRLSPPAHPQCRCALSVVVGFDREDLDPFNERVPSEEEVQAIRESQS